jgi:hypothetical protein
LDVQKGVVRTFSLVSPFFAERSGNPQPSFVKQILHRKDQSYCFKEVKDADAMEPRIIDFSAPLEQLSAVGLITLAKAAGKEQPSYQDRIVIIGGSLQRGEDMKDTPVGPLSGLEINGLALATMIHDRARTELTEGETILIDVAVAIILVLCGLWSPVLTVCATLILLVICFLVSYWVYQHGLFLSFLPIVVGMWVHLGLERSRHSTFEDMP